ncbi:MAG: DUF4234 domain-containing protein [Solirubrobacterales bacterium]
MAEIVPISGGPETAKIRSPIAVVALSVVTLTIYQLFWWYFVNRELADLGRKHDREDLGTKPLLSALAIFPGFLLLGIPTIVTTITTYQRMKRAQQLIGVEPQQQGNPWIYGVAYVAISLVAWGYLQRELNKIWRIDSNPVQEGIPATAPAAAMPAPPALIDRSAPPEPLAPPGV